MVEKDMRGNITVSEPLFGFSRGLRRGRGATYLCFLASCSLLLALLRTGMLTRREIEDSKSPTRGAVGVGDAAGLGAQRAQAQAKDGI
jgi:hypothetical protein